MGRHRTDEEIKQIKIEVIGILQHINEIRASRDTEIKKIWQESKAKENALRPRLRRLKRIVSDRQALKKRYQPKDHTSDLAWTMFGKRRRDLNADELRAFNAECQRRRRQRLKEKGGK